MSWHFSQALVEEYSEANSLGGERFVQWKLMPFAQDDLCSAKMKGTFHRSPYGMMFVPSTEGHGMELLMWFLADSLAKTSVQRICAQQELEAQEVLYGNKCTGLFAKYDLNLRSWKTAQCSLFEDLEPSLETWPHQGIMLNGECFRQKMLDFAIQENEYLLRVPTPTASDWKRMPLKKEYANKPLAGGTADSLSQYMARAFYNTFEGKTRWYPIPTLWEAIQGWPEAWTDSRPLETVKFQQWLDLHGKS